MCELQLEAQHAHVKVVKTKNECERCVQARPLQTLALLMT